MKIKVKLTWRKYVNLTEQEGRVVTGYHAVPLDNRGTLVQEIVECDTVNITESVVLGWRNEAGDKYVRSRCIPLDLLWSVETETT